MSFEEELEQLQRQDKIAPLGIDETVKWCKRFVLVPKANRKVRLCLNPARLNQALIRPVQRGSTLNDILLKLNNAQYLSLIYRTSGYHNPKLMKILIPDNICIPIWQIQVQKTTV